MATTTNTTLPPDEGVGFFINVVDCQCFTIHKTKTDAVLGKDPLWRVSPALPPNATDYIGANEPWMDYSLGRE